jgi:hypothetical protein
MEKINWKTMAGDYIPVQQMYTTHIINTYNCIMGRSLTVIPPNWCGRSHLQWQLIFENELNNRGFGVTLNPLDINGKFKLKKIK